MKYNRFINASACILSAISSVILIETIFQTGYQDFKLFISQNSKYLADYIISRNNDLFSSNAICRLPEIETVPKGSTVIIGHAYGSPYASESRGNVGMAPSVSNFLKENEENIETLALTGDVFHTPSLSKWDNLYNKYKSSFEIFIVPGNHDVGWNFSNSRRDIFDIYISEKQPKKMPFLIYRNGFNLILDDSLKTNGYSGAIKTLANSIQSTDNLVVLKHQVGLSELSRYSNSYLDKRNFKITSQTKKIIEDDFSKFKEVIFIYGDGGGFSILPRIFCAKHSNIKHIINGIGEQKGDKIIILYNSKIYQHSLN